MSISIAWNHYSNNWDQLIVPSSKALLVFSKQGLNFHTHTHVRTRGLCSNRIAAIPLLPGLHQGFPASNGPRWAARTFKEPRAWRGATVDTSWHIGSVVIAVIHSGIWGRYYGIIVYVITSFFTVGIFVVVWGTISVGCFMPEIGCDW